MPAVFDFIDIYCERTGPGIWAEPLNVFSNLVFFFAVFAAYRLGRRQGALTLDASLLFGLLVLMGTGSSLFHMLANRWAQLADVLPILFYQLAFIGIYASRVMRWDARKSALLLAVFLAMVFVFGLAPSGWLNGSLGYAPSLLFLIGLGVYHYSHAFTARSTLLLAAGIFAVSLTVRSVDMIVCPTFPAGVHFIWHLLNGAVLYFTMLALLPNLATSRVRTMREAG